MADPTRTGLKVGLRVKTATVAVPTPNRPAVGVYANAPRLDAGALDEEAPPRPKDPPDGARGVRRPAPGRTARGGEPDNAAELGAGAVDPARRGPADEDGGRQRRTMPDSSLPAPNAPAEQTGPAVADPAGPTRPHPGGPWFAALLISCGPASVVTPAPWPCGDGVLDVGELCDDGAANSDVIPGACRTDCLPARCGDGTTDLGEACDDGGTWAGDGCDPTCADEVDPGEIEPNDVAFNATPASAVVRGALPSGDVDCWAVDVAENGWLHVRATDWQGGCDAPLVLTLGDGEETLTQAIAAAGACATLDPADDGALAFLARGTYAVCVHGLIGAEVEGYALEINAGDDSCDGAVGAPRAAIDPDGDGLANACDPDDDGDGVLDGQDNCRLVANGPNTPAPDTREDGYVRVWATLGAFEDDAPTDGCVPSEEPRAGEPNVEPGIGLTFGGVGWTAVRSPGNTLDLLTVYDIPTIREAYAATWVYTPATRDVTLAMGVDDGARVWLNGVQVGEVTTCQGVGTDAFTWPVTLTEGWNVLSVKIRDRGGGWGVRARFKDAEGQPLRNLEVSPAGPWSWRDDQGDADNDGVGDACDPSFDP